MAWVFDAGGEWSGATRGISFKERDSTPVGGVLVC